MALYDVAKMAEDLMAESGYSLDWLIKERESPGFDLTHKRIHEWQRYIPKTVQVGWSLIPRDCRLLLIAICQMIADKEEWD